MANLIVNFFLGIIGLSFIFGGLGYLTFIALGKAMMMGPLLIVTLITLVSVGFILTYIQEDELSFGCVGKYALKIFIMGFSLSAFSLVLTYFGNAVFTFTNPPKIFFLVYAALTITGMFFIQEEEGLDFGCGCAFFPWLLLGLGLVFLAGAG